MKKIDTSWIDRANRLAKIATRDECLLTLEIYSSDKNDIFDPADVLEALIARRLEYV